MFLFNKRAPGKCIGRSSISMPGSMGEPDNRYGNQRFLASLNRQRAIKALVKPLHWGQQQLEARFKGQARQRAWESMWRGYRAVWATLALPPPQGCLKWRCNQMDQASLAIRGSKDCSAIYCVCSFRNNHSGKYFGKIKAGHGIQDIGSWEAGYWVHVIQDSASKQCSALNCECSIRIRHTATGLGMSGLDTANWNMVNGHMANGKRQMANGKLANSKWQMANGK